MFRAHVLIIRWSELHYTASGIITPTGMIIFISVFNQLDAQNFCFTISLFHASTCFEHMCSSSGGQNLHYTASGIITPIGDRLVHEKATYRCDDTRGCVMQF